MTMLLDTIGLDLHKRETQICIITADGQLVERRIATTRARFTEVLGNRPRARILLEASTESEWVARHLEGLGHEVIVADPSYAPMYATRSRRVKTDKRDARTLAEACRLGAYRAIHRVSDAQRHVRAELAVRDALVRTRTRYVALIKAAIRREGQRLAQGEPERTHRDRRGRSAHRPARGHRSHCHLAHDGADRGEAIAARRGKRVAVVALARKLAAILYAMWRDNAPYRTTATTQSAEVAA